MDSPQAVVHKGAEILVAEDSPTQAEKLKYLLCELNYVVTIAANGKQALAAARKRKPAILITDVVMPEMSGFDLCKAIKSEPDLRNIPVILVTSLASAQDVIKGLECGADNFIRKPYDEKYLFSRIDYLLTNRVLRKTEKVQIGVEVYFDGQRHFITSERQQILDLLISTYEGAVQINEELEAKQEKLKHSEQELRIQTKILRSILESMGDGVIVRDENGRLLFSNAAAEKLLGVGPAVGKPAERSERYELFKADQVTPYPPNEMPMARAMCGEAVDAEEVCVHDPNGKEPTWLSATARPLRNENGALQGGVVVFHDVTNRRRAEEAILKAKEEAERATRFKDQFLSTMSHELRTPLNAVLGFSDLLADERYGPLNERQQRYVQNIHNGGRHLLRLISDILDLSKIQAGRLELSFENVRLDQALGEVVSAMQPLADKKSQALSQLAAPGLTVRADVTRLKQILMNLVGNAVKFTPEQGRIELIARRNDEKVRVEVRDTGPGIPPEEQKRIFEAFYRLRQGAGATEGTGLGLAITQRLVELHGEQLGLDSQPGEGSCFYFTLPVASEVREETVRQSQVTSATTELSRILVIEGNSIARQLIQSQLTSSGYETLLCDQPENGPKIAAELQPDAITLDPLTDPAHAWRLLVRLKNDPRTATIPVIAVTSGDQPAIGALLGADEYLLKPVEKEAMLAGVRRCLAIRSAAPPERPILVVEDDRRTLEFIGESLKAQGYAVTLAADGAQARSHVASSLPEMVILDLLLPKVSGLELLREWRANPRTADLPIFILTSKNLSREEQKYLRAHAEYLLDKQEPWQEALVNQLQRVLLRPQRVSN